MSESKGCPYASKFASKEDLKYAPESVVAKHAQYFAEKDGTLTQESMKEGHDKQSIFKTVGIKIRAILNLLDKDPSVKHVSAIENPAATGLWNKEGNFDEKRFEQLASKAITDKDKKIITKQMFGDLRKEVHGNTKHGNATHIFYFVPVSWSAVTDGSVNELFEYYADHWYKNKCGKYEKALTVEQVKAFYTDPNALMEKRIAGLLPVPCPDS